MSCYCCCGCCRLIAEVVAKKVVVLGTSYGDVRHIEGTGEVSRGRKTAPVQLSEEQKTSLRYQVADCKDATGKVTAVLNLGLEVKINLIKLFLFSWIYAFI